VKHALALALSLACGCAPETVKRPVAPIDWASFATRTGLAAPVARSATAKERDAAGVYLAALSASDLGALSNVLDDDAHFAFAGFHDVHGFENVSRAHAALFGEFEPRTIAADRILLTDRSQAIEWTLTGMAKSSEKPLAFRGLTLLWTKDDGSVVDVHVYFDEAVVRAELGRGPLALANLPPPPLPSGPPVVSEQHGDLDEHENVDRVRAQLDALEGTDESAYANAVTDDFELVTLERAEPERGKAAARAYFKAMHKAIAHLDTSIDNVWGADRFVVVEYDVVGEQIGPLGLIPAQRNNLLKLFVADVVELRGDKIARIVRYDNPSQALTVTP